MIETITLQRLLEHHRLWLRGRGGQRAILRYADLSGTNLTGTNLKNADLSGTNLRGTNLTNADLSGVPRIERIHHAVAAAVGPAGEHLQMGVWHCGTSHCRAGWAVHLAGDAGYELERRIGTPGAAALIYIASDPRLARVPDFYTDDEEALADIKACAERERRREGEVV